MSEVLPDRDDSGRRIIRLPEAIFFDVDRCALDTKKAFDLAVEATAYNTPITGAQMHNEYKRAKRERESFNVVGFVNSTLSELQGDYTWKNDVEPHFVELGREHGGLAMKDARKIIDFAILGEYHLGMFTYGASSPDRNDQKWADAKEWQLAKVAACEDFDNLPVYVCNQRKKGDKITSWHKPDGFYLPDELSLEPGVQTVVDYAVLIDDKTDSFTGKNESLIGIRVTPEDENNQLDFQKGDLPAGVAAVYGMTEALGALKTVISLNRTPVTKH
jgi:hypothetical protein